MKVQHELYGRGWVFGGSSKPGFYYVKFYDFAEFKWVSEDEIILI